MATEEKTPDGYSISANGQWVQDGKPVHEEGKGVSSRRSVQVEKEIKAGTADSLTPNEFQSGWSDFSNTFPNPADKTESSTA